MFAEEEAEQAQAAQQAQEAQQARAAPLAQVAQQAAEPVELAEVAQGAAPAQQAQPAQPVQQAAVAQAQQAGQAPVAEPAEAIEPEEPDEPEESPENWKVITVLSRVPVMRIQGRVYNDQVKADDINYTRYIAFRGVPYAAPPIDDYRFQPPQPLNLEKTSFLGISFYPKWKAFQDKEPCLQRDVRNITYGKEDCLYLNVYLPKEPEKIETLLPVLVLFHGGDFLSREGNRREITPDSIIRENIVFVVVNYRTGPVGFLNMQTQSCRGNMGLKDQVQALRWIRDNIEAFKGNPNCVTISGHGASATCVNFHLISPMSAGLFHRAIIMSGGIYCPWGFKGHRREFRQLIRQAKDLPDDDDPRSDREEDTLEYKARKIVTEFFIQKSAEEFMEAANQIMDDYEEDTPPTQLTVYLGPSVEIKGDYTFIQEPITSMMKKVTNVPQIPVLAGISRNEGSQLYIGQSTAEIAEFARRERFFRAFLRQHFSWDDNTVTAKLNVIKSIYFGGRGLFDELGLTDEEIEQGLVKFFTDLGHRRFFDNFKFGENGRAFSKLYVYEFDYYSDLNKYWHKQLLGEFYRPNAGAGHGDELLYLFCPSDIRRKFKPFNTEVHNVIKDMCSLWATFCRDGAPHHQWTNHTDAVPCHMNIGAVLNMKNVQLNADRWRRLENLIEGPIMRSLQETPNTPDPPTILSSHWVDPEKLKSNETWKPVVLDNSRRGSSSLTRSSDSSRKTSLDSTNSPLLDGGTQSNLINRFRTTIRRLSRGYGPVATEPTSPTSSPRPSTMSSPGPSTMSPRSSLPSDQPSGSRASAPQQMPGSSQSQPNVTEEDSAHDSSRANLLPSTRRFWLPMWRRGQPSSNV